MKLITVHQTEMEATPKLHLMSKAVPKPKLKLGMYGAPRLISSVSGVTITTEHITGTPECKTMTINRLE